MKGRQMHVLALFILPCLFLPIVVLMTAVDLVANSLSVLSDIKYNFIRVFYE